MKHALLEIAVHIGVVGGLALGLALAKPRRLRVGWLLVALALMLLRDALVLRGYGLVPNLFPGSDWAWTGKLLATAGLLAVAVLPWFGLARCGLTLRQAPGSGIAWIAFAVLAAVIFGFAIHLGDGPADLDTILFQWSMPGIEEELFYRGLLLLALNEAFRAGRGTRPKLGIGCGGVLSSVAFGLGHALFWRADGPSFDALAFVMTGGPALLLVWFRTRTGSLLLPVLAHNTVNGAFTLF